MLVRSFEDCEEFIAGDKTVLRELLHPDKQDAPVRYSLAHAIVRHGDVSVPHALRTCEVYYIIEGEGLMHIDDEERSVVVGDTIVIPPNAEQWIENTGKSDLSFLAIVDPAWRVEDEIIIEN